MDESRVRLRVLQLGAQGPFVAALSGEAMTTPRNQQRVCVAYPYGHDVTSRFHHSLMNLFLADVEGAGRIIDGGGFIGNSSGANITNARNEIASTFLDRLTCDWLLFIDT